MNYYDRYGGIIYGLLLKLQVQHRQIDAEAVLTEVFCEVKRILSEEKIDQSLTLSEILAICRRILKRDQIALDLFRFHPRQ